MYFINMLGTNDGHQGSTLTCWGLMTVTRAQLTELRSAFTYGWYGNPSRWRISGYRTESMTLDNSGHRAWRVPRSLHLKDLLDFEKELGAL